MINQMITRQRNVYAWEFLFLAANQDAIATAARMGIDPGMASSVEFSKKGMRDSSASFGRKLKSMRSIYRTEEEQADYMKSMNEIVMEEEAKD
jgi:hypothetical protein